MTCAGSGTFDTTPLYITGETIEFSIIVTYVSCLLLILILYVHFETIIRNKIKKIITLAYKIHKEDKIITTGIVQGQNK